MNTSPNLAAYVLLGDPAWLVPSIRSYYDHVDTIFASYDLDGLSWAGHDMSNEIERCLGLLKEIDVDGKIEFAGGRFSQPGRHPAECDTAQRQHALDAASQAGEWILQLDTDEIVADRDVLLQQLDLTRSGPFKALEYPAIWIYSHVRGNVFLARSARRRWRIWDAIPGPIAVQRGTKLTYCRQTEAPVRRVSLSREPKGRLDEVNVSAAIHHFSMVRTPDVMERKSTLSSHAPDLDWALRLGLWNEARNHPIRGTLRSYVSPAFGSYRPIRIKWADGRMVAKETERLQI